MLCLGACGPSTEELLEYMSQTQTAGAPVPTPTPTQSSIPEGYVVIPDVIGMTREEAYELFFELGLVPLTFWVMHEDYEYGQVTDCDPAVGEVVPVESEIVLDVVGKLVKDKDKDSGDSGGPVDCGPPPPLGCTVTLQNWCACKGGTYVCHDPVVSMASCDDIP